jgi:hypothetical protein
MCKRDGDPSASGAGVEGAFVLRNPVSSRNVNLTKPPAESNPARAQSVEPSRSDEIQLGENPTGVFGVCCDCEIV